MIARHSRPTNPGRRPLTVLGPLAAGLAVAMLAAACGPAGGGDGQAGELAEPASRPVSQAEPKRAVDVLLVTIDTLRADALGAYGNPRAETPTLDRLARMGLRFDDARAHNVVTLPSHATILSGKYPFEHGIRDNSGFRFPEQEATLATILSERGYRTGAFVSAFPLAARFGLDVGFDVYDDAFVDAGNRPAFFEQERAGTETVALARRWLSTEEETPSFAWVHLYEPHFPYAPPPPFDRTFADDPYLGDVAAADAALAPLLTPILDAGADGDTLVVVTSDHGEALGEHGEATHGIFAYESTLRVPLIVYHPRLLEPDVVRETARLLDLLPTILDLLDLPPSSGLPGRGLTAPGSAAESEASVATYFEALSGQLHRGWAPLFGVVQEGWKYIDLPIPELYDLANDPAEERNLVAEHPQRVGQLSALLADLRSSDPGAAPAPEDEETRRRLRALGYLSDAAAGSTGPNRVYTPEDDPKRLIGLDTVLRQVTGLWADGELERARTLCRELLARRPDMRMALMTLAQIERDLGNLDAATEAMRRAFELYPEDSSTLALLVSYLTQAGRPGEAADLSAPHAARPRPDVEVLLVRSLALARDGRSQEALAMIDRAGELEPENPKVAVYRGTLRLMAGQHSEARAAFEAALATNPATVAAHTSLAVLETEDGNLETALHHWQQAIDLEPRESAKLLAIAGRLWSTGNRDAARPLLELFVESAPPELFGREIESVDRMLAATP